MKKQLLLGSALLAAISAFPQQAVTKEKVRSFNMASYLSKKFERQLNPVEPSHTATKSTPQANPVHGPQADPSQVAKSSGAAIAAPGTWNPFTGSMNIYGNLVSYSRPLVYNDNIQAVSFIHRKSDTYVPNPFPQQPGAQSGAIVGMITNDWGNEWDTTLLWNDENYWGRYPQGGLFAPPGVKCMDSGDVYIIATGPITAVAGGWVGSFFASKPVDTMGGPGNNDTVSTGINDHQFIANSGSLPYGKVDFPRLDFTVTDDGVVRVLGILADDVNGTTNAAYGFRGASVVQGTFISGTFSWMVDSVVVDTAVVFSSASGGPYVLGSPHMAWNEAGTVGYVWFIGALKGQTGSNVGYQPIVFKWTTNNPSWTLQPGIDFNDTAGGKWNDVFSHLLATNSNSNLAIPFFTSNEGQDGTVDRNDRLHIVSTVVGGYSAHPDSLGYTFIINHADGEQYRWGHVDGWRPTIFDFVQTPTGWMVQKIDEMGTEAPGVAAGTAGYGDNPWDAAGGTSGTDKVDADARIQVSRTPDGRYIVYTFAESDTGFTSSGRKWNSLPNVKARLVEVGVESGSTPASISLHPTEINVTKPVTNSLPPYTTHNQVADRAVMHYISPEAAIISNTASSGISIGLPITVSNNSFVPMKQLNPVTHYYLSANLNFDGLSQGSIDWPTGVCGPKVDTTNNDSIPVAIAAYKKFVESSNIYPNPSNGSAQLSIVLEQGNDVEVTVSNAIGQLVRTVRHKGQAGENNIDLQAGNLESGLYLVNIRVGDAKATRKLVIQR